MEVESLEPPVAFAASLALLTLREREGRSRKRVERKKPPSISFFFLCSSPLRSRRSDLFLSLPPLSLSIASLLSARRSPSHSPPSHHRSPPLRKQSKPKKPNRAPPRLPGLPPQEALPPRQGQGQVLPQGRPVEAAAPDLFHGLQGRHDPHRARRRQAGL